MCTSSIRLSKTTRWRHDYCVHECNELHAIFPSSFGVVYSCARALQNSSIIQASGRRRGRGEGFCAVAGSGTFWKKKKVSGERDWKKKKVFVTTTTLPACALPSVAAAVFLAWVSINMEKYIKATFTFAVFGRASTTGWLNKWISIENPKIASKSLKYIPK